MIDLKIVVFTCNTGGGHNSCAKYIKQEFEKNNILCDVKDYMEFFGDKASEISEKLYLGSTKGNGNAFKFIYKVGELFNETGLKSPVYNFNKKCIKKLDQFLVDNKYDLAIGTHVFPCLALTALKKERNIKFINVATDYECTPFWNETTPDLFVIPSKLLTSRFVSKGMDENILFPFGIPVASSFFSFKNNVSLPTNKKIVLLTSGSMGFGAVEKITKKILENVDCFLVVVCGNNIKLQNILEKIKNDNLLVLGFINNINEYMNLSNVIVAKPGGLTTTEISMMRKPLVHMMPIPGVENYNAEFFATNKMSLRANNIEEVVDSVKRLLNDEILQKEIIENQEKNINKNSAKDLVDYVLNNFEN